VLAVDDHPVNRSALARHLAAWGLKPLIAADAAEAQRLFAENRVDLLIVDHDLDGSSGRELFARLKTGRASLPAVLFTSSADNAQRDSADPLLLTLPKPIKPAILHEALLRLLAGQTRPEETSAANGRPKPVLANHIPLDVLIVEDNPVNQKVAQLLLERFGYVADIADNGVDALNAMARRPYQLVLMDVQMPGMDGLATSREIRARAAPGPRPVIVALTANAMRGDRERCLAAGMDDYLSKPVKSDDIELVILRHFGQKAG
jgi:CheY-like chemotaxis protein